MATQVTQFYFLQDPPIGGGNDWEVIILGPNGGNAEISFDNGATWLQANQGYDGTYGGYRYRPPCYGGLSCTDPRQGNWVVLGRMVGETESIKAVFSTYEDSPTDDVYEFVSSAVCVGGNISLNFLSQYSQNGPDNYQLFLPQTQTLQLSINGTPLSVKTQSVDSCPIGTCHYSQVYNNITVPASAFPLTAVFSDSANVLRVSTVSIPISDFGNPCVAAPNPTANAVDDPLGNQPVGLSSNVIVGTNDTACDVGTTTWTLISGSEVNVTIDSFPTSGSVNYTPTAPGAFSFQYEIRCDGVVLDTATVSGTGVAACVNVSGGGITGLTPVVPGSSNTYNAAGFTGTLPYTYVWSTTAGTITAGQGTDTVTITTNTAGNVDVTVTNCSGAGSVTLSFPITLEPPTADAVDDNVGSQTVGIPQTVDVSVNDTLCSSGVTTFALTGSPVNTTASLASGSTFNYTPAAPGPFSFQYDILCDGIGVDTATVSGTAVAGCVNVTTTPVTGNASVFAGTPENYTATPDGTAPHTYVWTAVGGTINSGQGTATVNVTFTGSGSISVVVTNCVGAGTANGTLPITLITAVAVDDSVTTSINTPVVIQMAANDTLCN